MNVEARTPGNGFTVVTLADTESSGSDGVVYLVGGVPGLPTQTVQQFLGTDTRFTYVLLGHIFHVYNSNTKFHLIT